VPAPGERLVVAYDGALPGATVHDAIFRFDLTTHALTLGYKMSGVKHLVPSAGSVSQKFWGSHLLGAISLTCNGVRAADFHVNSTQALAATVLAGATIRPANVTTANGTVTRRQSFTIQ
jgi:hypothetical protein